MRKNAPFHSVKNNLKNILLTNADALIYRKRIF